MADSRARRQAPKIEPETIEMPPVNDVEKLRQYHAEIGAMLAKLDPNQSAFDRVSTHVRRHFPLYALVAIFGLIIALVPTTNDPARQSASDITSGDTSGDFTDTTVAGDTAAKKKSTSNRVAQRTTSTGPVAAQDTGGGEDPVGQVATGTGKTLAGFECKPGVRQLPWSLYANPCVAKFTGNNGGATYRGVTDKTIRIAIRKPAIDAGDITDAQASAQGAATRAEGIAMFKKYASYFDKTFELYGRKLEFVDFQSRSSNGVEEAQSRGEEGARADCTALADTHKVFGVVGYNGGLTETQPFADCAAEKGLFLPHGASYFPEKWYQERWDPYVWHVLQECERIAHDVAEYIGKRLLNKNATWALDATYKVSKRKLGTYVPDNDGYQRCVGISESDLVNKYGAEKPFRFDYALEVQRFPDQARTAVVQFKAEKVTTLINACDTLSSRFLTEAADDIEWGPEWFIIGVATQDTDGAARTFDEAVVDGHLFGLSQLGKTALIEGKKGEPYATWSRAFPNEEPPTGFGAVYFRVLAIYMMLMAGGPNLTPANIAKGLRALPDGGGAKGAYGTWSFKGDHTAVDDSREVYWMESATGFDGAKGSYLETYGGKRFRTGEWPKETPKIYPG